MTRMRSNVAYAFMQRARDASTKAFASRRRALFASAAALIVSGALGFMLDARAWLACWLASWWWCASLILGVFVNAWMHRLTGGEWGRALRPVAIVCALRWRRVLPLALPIALGLARLYPWAAASDPPWWRDIERPEFLRAWFDPPFVHARLALYGAAWWWITRPSSFARTGRAALSLALYGFGTSLATADLVMSLLPGWSSTAFGLVAMSMQSLAGAAFAIRAIAQARPEMLARRRDGHPPLARDHGNLLLMWTMLWAYLAFMQFLIIWAENLPREIVWYLPRMHGAWGAISLVVALAQFALPLAALLFRAIKDRPERLRRVAGVMLVGAAVNVAWSIVPSIAAEHAHVVWLLPLTMIAMTVFAFDGVQAEVNALDFEAAATVDDERTVRHAAA